MATRGPKPKPTLLRIVDGTHRTTRHGDAAEVRDRAEAQARGFGPLAQPAKLRGRVLDAWKRYIAPAAWLDASREPLALQFCELWAEFRSKPREFPASKHGQMRACQAELGLTDERNRPKDDNVADEFFDK